MRKSKDTVILTDLKKGSKGIVKTVGKDPEKKRKLLALGIFPGEEIVLVHKYPVLLLQLGYSFVAVDQRLGGNIQVTLKE